MNEYSWHKVNVIFLLHDFAVYSAKLWNLSKVDPTIKKYWKMKGYNDDIGKFMPQNR